MAHYVGMGSYMGSKGHTTGRNCVRCRKELTDAASMEVGIGPICRRLDNALLAARIPSDVYTARTFVEMVQPEKLDPATVDTYRDLANALYAPQSESRADWRVEVKRLEWLLSFEASRTHALKALTEVVRALGYVGLAALWEGKASTGVAKMRCDGTRLYITGPRNPSFRMEVKKIVGWRFHYAKGDSRPEWSVPVQSAAALNRLVLGHYPNCADREAALEEAKTAAKAPAAPIPAIPAQAAPKAPPAPQVAPVAPPAPQVQANRRVRVVEAANGRLQVYTPYVPVFISELKDRIDYRERSWNPTDKCWEVNPAYRETVRAVIEAHFQMGDVVPMVSGRASPAEAFVATLPAGVMPF